MKTANKQYYLFRNCGTISSPIIGVVVHIADVKRSEQAVMADGSHVCEERKVIFCDFCVATERSQIFLATSV